MDTILPDDVLDRILQFAPDFKTLRSAILVSKHFYEAYSEHPKTITRWVAWNITGPALPQAIRLVRHPECRRIRDESDSDSEDGASLGDIDVYASVETTDGPPLTVAEQDKLSEYAETARKLEDIFSFRSVTTRNLGIYILT